MTDGKCTKHFRKDFTDTITIVNGYPIYCWRNTDHGRQSFTLNIYNALTIVGWYHFCLCWTKHSMLILMLSSAVQWSPSNTLASTWLKAAMWLFKIHNTDVNAPWLNDDEILVHQLQLSCLAYIWFPNSWTEPRSNTFNHSSGHFPILLAMYCRTIYNDASA